MKRFLSLFLVLATLLCMIPFTVSAEAVEPEANAAESDATYLDLYVKDGLVALFDAYSLTASNTQLYEWTPVAFFGNEDYPDYIDPTLYTRWLSNTGHAQSVFAWRAGDGYMIPTVVKADGTETYTYLNLSGLGALIGTVVTTQEVFHPGLNVATPIVEDGVVTNYASLVNLGAVYQGRVGSMWIGGMFYGKKASPDATHTGVGIFAEQCQITGNNYIGHNLWIGNDVGFNQVTPLSATDSNGSSVDLSGVYVGGPLSIERTVIRHPYTTSTAADETVTYTVTFERLYHTNPTMRGGNWGSSYGKISTSNKITEADANSTALILAADNSATYSVRVYNKMLSKAEIAQNHMADMVAFYGINAGEVLALGVGGFSSFVDAAQEFEIAYSGKDLTKGSEYMENKAALEAALAEAKAEDDATYYLNLYVTDGLVALFDANSATASATNLTAFVPVNFYGAEGYEDYVDPSSYSVTFTNKWNYVDGGVEPTDKAASGSANFAGLNALVGTTYTFQEVFTHMPTTLPVVEGDTITNLAGSSYGKFEAARYGAVGLSILTDPNRASGALGHTGQFYMVSYTQIDFYNAANTASGYKGHHYFQNPENGTAHYDTLGGISNVYVGGGTTVERSIFRFAATFDGTNYSSSYKIGYVVAPVFRNAWNYFKENYFSQTFSSATEADHTTTRLTAMADTATYYSVRMYNKELSSAEILQNHFADLTAFFRADGALLREFNALSSVQKAIIYNQFASFQLTNSGRSGVGYASDKAAFLSAFEGAMEIAKDRYNELYVKDGLVALFDAYKNVADPNTSLTTWAPVNLYGAEGYEDYIDPSTYNVTLTGTNCWTAVDGGLHTAWLDSVINLDELGAKIDGYAFSVQEVFSRDNGVTVKNGVLDLTDWTSWGDYNLRAKYGALSITPLITNVSVATAGYGDTLIGSQAAGLRGILYGQYVFRDGSGYVGHFYLTGEINNAVWAETAVSADGATDLSGYLIGGPAATERTVIREGVSTTVSGETTTYTSAYQIHYQYGAEMRYNTNGLIYDHSYSVTRYNTDADSHLSKSLRLSFGQNTTAHAVRVYNRRLHANDFDQNHMADLVGYYGIDVEAVLALSIAERDSFMAAIKDITISHSGKSLKAGSEYLTKRALVVEALEAAKTAPTEEERWVEAYRTLYVADGLVALFDGHTVTSSGSTTVNGWAPVNLYGAEGYEDYYAAIKYYFSEIGGRFKWYTEDGGYINKVSNGAVQPWNSETYLTLDSLGKTLGTTYTVQEVTTYNRIIPEIENGVVTNYATELYTVGNMSYNKVGGFKFGGSPRIDAKPDGVNILLGVVCEQLAFGGDYAGHFTYRTEEMGATLYDSLVSETGSTTFENVWVASPMTAERTVFRLGVTESVKDDVTTYTAKFGTFYNHKPWHRTGGNWISANTTFSRGTTDSALAYNTQLRLAGNNGLVRSIRIYNRELTQNEIYQNHLADLAAVYELSTARINAVKALSATTFAALCEAAYSIDIAASDEQWADAKVEFEDLVTEYVSKEEAAMNAVVSFGGLSYRTSGNYGLRVMFKVDKDAIAYLESCGYSVEYGAIMAVKSNAGTDYNASAADLTVKVGNDGKIVLASGNAATIVSTDAGLKHLTDDNASFAFTTVYDLGKDGENSIYDATMLYRGFVVVTDAEGNATIVYDELNVTSNAALNTPSLRALHNHVLANDPTLSEAMIKRLNFIEE